MVIVTIIFILFWRLNKDNNVFCCGQMATGNIASMTHSIVYIVAGMAGLRVERDVETEMASYKI